MVLIRRHSPNPTAGTFGNCGRNTLRGPWRGTQDISVIKFFPISERKNVEFRMEMFNAPNHLVLNVGGQLGWGNGSNPAQCNVRHDHLGRNDASDSVRAEV
jgi:hypothetical protein